MKQLIYMVLLVLPIWAQAQIGMTLQNQTSCNIPFISTWNTANTVPPIIVTDPPNPTNEIILPLLAGGSYAFSIDWGDGSTGFVTNANMATAATHTYAAPGIYTLTITGKIDGWQMLSTERLKITDVSQWGCLLRAGNRAFNDCANLDVSATDSLITEGITNFSSQFRGCSSLTSLDVSAWNVDNGTNFSAQFNGCSSLTTLDVSAWDVDNGTNFSFQFNGCSSLTSLDVSAWNVDNGTNFASQFRGCPSLTTLDVSAWDVDNGTNFGSQFSGCSSLTTLDVSAWDVDNGTNFNTQFNGCPSLTTLDVSNWDVDNGTNFGSQFRGCSSLTTLDVSAWDVDNGTNFSSQFRGCSSLTSLDVSAWDVSQATNMTNFMFNSVTTTALYDQTLINWEALSLQPNIDVHFGNSQYTAGGAAETARTNIITNDNWTITDGGSL